jgi:hypothetical protein
MLVFVLDEQKRQATKLVQGQLKAAGPQGKYYPVLTFSKWSKAHSHNVRLNFVSTKSDQAPHPVAFLQFLASRTSERTFRSSTLQLLTIKQTSNQWNAHYTVRINLIRISVFFTLNKTFKLLNYSDYTSSFHLLIHDMYFKLQRFLIDSDHT